MKTLSSIFAIATFVLFVSQINAQDTMASIESMDNATTSKVELSEQKNNSRHKSAAAKEMFEIETNQAAAMITQFVNEKVLYPKLLSELGMESAMEVDFFIDRQGKIQKIMITKGDSKVFNEKVLDILQEMKDIKIRHYLGASRLRIPINFSLK